MSRVDRGGLPRGRQQSMVRDALIRSPRCGEGEKEGGYLEPRAGDAGWEERRKRELRARATLDLPCQASLTPPFSLSKRDQVLSILALGWYAGIIRQIPGRRSPDE